jgi:preprotein translocase SecE subunit
VQQRRETRINNVASFKTYLSESYNELVNKVSWPTWKELQSSAIVVLVSALIISLIVFLMDFIFGVHNMGATAVLGKGSWATSTNSSDSEWRPRHQEMVCAPGHQRQGEEGEGDDRGWKMRRSNMGQHIAQVLIPMEKFYQIRDGKKVSKERNFFPGYVLMEADLTGEIAHTLKQMPNVIGFLGAEKGGDPVPLRQSEVNRILGTVDELAETDEAPQPLPCG